MQLLLIWPAYPSSGTAYPEDSLLSLEELRSLFYERNELRCRLIELEATLQLAAKEEKSVQTFRNSCGTIIYMLLKVLWYKYSFKAPRKINAILNCRGHLEPRSPEYSYEELLFGPLPCEPIEKLRPGYAASQTGIKPL
ncbi:unnamed protein product [Dibothriocephalus latus]|uniref:Uncharacterized protein n=1 Tax=Dibothriocephalus latus TaxID=60516 RepID=A0A3P7QW73_DIBLA|nr:unnamed protein product [Dibothriocephalus latus]